MRRWRRKNGRTRILSVLLCGFVLLGMIAPTVAYAMEELTAATHTVEGCEGESCAIASCTCTCHLTESEPESSPAPEGENEPTASAVHIEGCSDGCAVEGCACECHAAAESTTEPTEERLSEEEILYQLQNGGMTLMALEENGVQLRSVVQDAKIGLEYFNFVSMGSSYTGLNEDMVEHMKTFNNDQSSAYVKPGELAKNLPYVLEQGDVQITYNGSYVEGGTARTQIYHVGKLAINGTEYIYFVTDETEGTYTAYSVLKPNQKITVEYEKTSNHEVTYQFWNANGEEIDNGPDDWTLNDVFGEDRVQWVASGTHAELNVTVPRGYLCEIKTYHDNDGDGDVDTTVDPFWEYTLGGMQSYHYSSTIPGEQANIVLDGGSPEKTEYTVTKSNENITTNVIVVCEWQQIDTFNFNAWEWYQQDFAYQRIKAIDEEGKNSTENKSAFKTTFKNTASNQEDGNSYAWYFRGVTAKQHGVSGNRDYTWELDQLEINGVAIDVPTVSLNTEKEENNLPSRTTTLPTGTVVTVTITNWGGTNATDGFRDYKIEVTKCFENITITGGNMVSHSHREVAMDKYTGVKGGQYYTQENNKGVWNTLQQNTLAARTGSSAYTNAFRYQRESGYYGKANVTLTDKTGKVIQKNGEFTAPTGFPDSGNQYAIEYLVLTEDATMRCPTLFKDDNAQYGGLPVNRDPNGYMGVTPGNPWDPFEVVTYEKWTASWDGCYYFRMTSSLDTWMKEAYTNGVVFLSIEGVPLPGAVNYVDGADENGEDAPKPENVRNMPTLGLGGTTGYNCTTHDNLIIPGIVPQDVTGKFVFSHWEVLAVEYDNNDFKTGTLSANAYTVEGNDVRFSPNQGVEITEALDGILSDAFLWKTDAELQEMAPSQEVSGGRFVITLRAVWIDRAQAEASNYEVHFYIDGELVQVRRHAAPEGATIVTDLYKDYTDKTEFSDGIKTVLDGDNFTGKTYTGKYILTEDTTERIESVSRDNYIANIYLVRVDMDVSVQKHWDGKPDHDKPSTVAVVLQRQVVGEDESAWETYVVTEENANGGDTTNENGYFTLTVENTNDADSEIKTFKSLPRYVYDAATGQYDLTRQYRYRTLELDPNTIDMDTLQPKEGGVRQLGMGYRWTATCGRSCTYLASYVANYDENNNRKIDITNTYVGSSVSTLVINKAVDGTTSRDAYFEFEVIFSGSVSGTVNVGDTLNYGVDFKVSAAEAEFGGSTAVTATATLKLKAGEAAFVIGLPTWATVSIEEKLTDAEKQYYTTTIGLDEGADDVEGSSPFSPVEGNPLKVETQGDDGMPPMGLYTVTYHNHRAEANPITVKKEVAGKMGDVNKSWQFEITLNEPYTQSFGGISFTTRDGNSSVGYFSIKAGESKVISGLPDGIGYTIRETEANTNGYVTTYTKTVTELATNTVSDQYSVQTPTAHPSPGGVSGMATLEYTDEITFTNTKNVLIDNGIVLDSLPYIAILAVVLGGVVWMIIRRRRRDD